MIKVVQNSSRMTSHTAFSSAYGQQNNIINFFVFDLNKYMSLFALNNFPLILLSDNGYYHKAQLSVL